jgi:TonB family protein
MKLILAGKWPPLKPLPVFKYEADEYRASIEFDKTRGEWVCHKISFPSNKVQGLRGGLTEITLALPRGPAEVFTEDVAAEQPEQELEKDANRRLQAMLAWRKNYENGALYSELKDYLSESQQNEICDSIRLTLTARQLQCNPKNIASVFDALSKAGGRPAALIEMAQRNKAGQGADAQEQPKNCAPEPVRILTPEQSEGLAPEPVDRLLPTPLEDFPREPTGSVFPEQEQASSPEEIVHPASHASEIGPAEVFDASPRLRAEDIQEEVHHDTRVAGYGRQVRTHKADSSVDRVEDSRSRFPVLEISGFQIAAFAVFLFAVISFAVGLTMGRGLLGNRFRDAQKAIQAVDTAPPALPVVNPPAPESLAKERSTDSNSWPTIESKLPADSVGSPERNGSSELIARNAPLSNPKPTRSPKAVDAMSRVPRNPTPLRVMPAAVAAPHLSRPSTVLVRGPGNGSKPFRLTLPQIPIAASSSFAMTSQLSVVVPPEPGPAGARKPERLQAGELVSFVWPRYPRPGDRYGSSETVKVRTTIGKLGQVLDVKVVSGSSSLASAAMSAIRMWRYEPTLVNRKPVEVQQDVTIEFLPPQYLSRVHSQNPSHN